MLASCGPINLTVKPEEIWVFRQTATFFLKGLTSEGRDMEHFQIFLGHSKGRKRPKDECSRTERKGRINEEKNDRSGKKEYYFHQGKLAVVQQLF